MIRGAFLLLVVILQSRLTTARASRLIAPPELRRSMTAIASLEPGFYRVPLPAVLTDSTHGEMRDFELNTVRVRDADGAEGVGYTFTVGRNGGAIDDILRREMPRDAGGRGRRPDRAALAEDLVGAALWRPRRPDRAGALRRRHGAVGSQGQARRHCRSGACSAATTRRCPATPAASTSTCRSTSSCARPTAISPRASAPSR